VRRYDGTMVPAHGRILKHDQSNRQSECMRSVFQIPSASNKQASNVEHDTGAGRATGSRGDLRPGESPAHDRRLTGIVIDSDYIKFLSWPENRKGPKATIVNKLAQHGIACEGTRTWSFSRA